MEKRSLNRKKEAYKIHCDYNNVKYIFICRKMGRASQFLKSNIFFNAVLDDFDNKKNLKVLIKFLFFKRCLFRDTNKN